jgi:hypothetical protein
VASPGIAVREKMMRKMGRKREICCRKMGKRERFAILRVCAIWGLLNLMIK